MLRQGSIVDATLIEAPTSAKKRDPVDTPDEKEKPMALLHGDEAHAHSDAGFMGIHKHEEHANRNVQWQIAARPGKRQTMNKGSNELNVKKKAALFRGSLAIPQR